MYKLNIPAKKLLGKGKLGIRTTFMRTYKSILIDVDKI